MLEISITSMIDMLKSGGDLVFSVLLPHSIVHTLPLPLKRKKKKMTDSSKSIPIVVPVNKEVFN